LDFKEVWSTWDCDWPLRVSTDFFFFGGGGIRVEQYSDFEDKDWTEKHFIENCPSQCTRLVIN